MKRFIGVMGIILLSYHTVLGQLQKVEDDFEGYGTINSWFGDACDINISMQNPLPDATNASETVMEYNDNGGLYANVRFDVDQNFDLTAHHTFTFLIYVPSAGLTGTQTNQVALKLQDGTRPQPWSTQCEISKTLVLDAWQLVTFDFKNDDFINLDQNSHPPTERNDFNRVVIQINGENNSDQVLAYIDDFAYDGVLPEALESPLFSQLVWSDEFDVDGGINTDNWFHQTQLPLQGSWYNGEVQHYTSRTENAFVQNGILSIVAKKEVYTDQGYTKDYTSARLNSKLAFKYGRVEVRARLPVGVGTWPAIWMLGKNIDEDGAYWDNQGYGTSPWPACGEIDIMEHWGANQNYVQSATHTPSSSGSTVNLGGQLISSASTEFHVYSLEWTSNRLVFAVDDQVHYTYEPAVKNEQTWPFDEEQYLIFNVAIQSSIAPSFTQAAMEIDYVRIYQEGAATSIDNKLEISSKAYPNPFHDELNIMVETSSYKSIQVRMYNSSGQLIRDELVPADGGLFCWKNLNGLSKGVYIIHINTGNDMRTMKVIKE